MECSMTGGYTNGAPPPTSTTTGGGILSDVRSERSPSKTGLHVNFKDKGEVKERREKYLTAKYGPHQMSLIRKRLAVEMWMYEELRKLNEVARKVDNQIENEVEIDLDFLLDIDSEEERRLDLQKLLAKLGAPQPDVKKFIDGLLDKANTL